VSDLRATFSPDLVAALERLVDERIAAALAERENGSEPSWLSISEAAEYLRVSPSTIARMLKHGRVRSSCVGRRRLVRRSDLDQQSG
jgi:excisionase family DNA binding protein